MSRDRDDDNLEKEMLFRELREEINNLKLENMKLNKTLEEYGITEISPITDVEYVCIKGIQDLKLLADSVGLTQDDSKILDTLHKNLRMARGKMEVKTPKGAEKSVEELMSIVEGGKK